MHQTKDFIWTLLFFGSAVSLEVEITPSHSEITLGQSKFFMCEAVGEVQEIEWFSPSGEKILNNRKDISITKDAKSSTLIIYNSGIDKAGTYTCVARNAETESRATVNVIIFQQLEIKSAPSPQEFNEGDHANIVCDVVGSPNPMVTWKHKGTKIKMEKDVRYKVLNNNHLQIRGIKKTDEGAYVCEGRIMARGEIRFKSIQVIVNVLPSIRTRQDDVNATADMGRSAVLTCDADGYPEPTVTWERNNVLLEAGHKYDFNEDGSEMTIKDVSKVDEGEYTCIAKNKAGKEEKEIGLHVFVRPKITFLENQTASELEEITLTCEATGDPTPSIGWSFGRHVFSEGEQASWTRPETHKSLDSNVVVRSDARVSSLTLKYVQFTDAGQYLCTARNSIGLDTEAMFLEVIYAPKIYGTLIVFTWEGNPANISCEVLAHPGASVVWFRDGLQLPSWNVTNVRIFMSPSVSYLEVTPESQNDFGSYNCTATNVIGAESKEFLLIQADVPSAPSVERVEPYSNTAQVEFDEPDATGGVPILKYKAEWRVVGKGHWTKRVFEAKDGSLSAITISGLRPVTDYEVKMSAINGRGEGENSPPLIFRTEPVNYSFTRKPSPPKLEGKLQSTGNALKVTWIKQDDGGSPIKHYLVRYKAKGSLEWKPEIRLPSGGEYVLLQGLDWNTEYDVFVVAENQLGKSQPGGLTFRTAPEPSAIPDPSTRGSGLGTGATVGILIFVFVLLLVLVDVTCFFINKCGLLMCIAVNLCGKSGPGAKSTDFEEGLAAFSKDESKEPIVEVRTEEERTPNHDGGVQTEPNEMTPLTEPEISVDASPAVVDLAPSGATNSDTVTESLSTSQNSPASECTTLSLSTAAADRSVKTSPSLVPQSSTPKAKLANPISPTVVEPKVAPLVDLGDDPVPVTKGPSQTNLMETPEATPAAPTRNATEQTTSPSVQSPETPENDVMQVNAVKNQAGLNKTPSGLISVAPPPSRKQELPVGKGCTQTADSDPGKDVFGALDKQPSKPPPGSTAESMTDQDDKIPADDKRKSEGPLEKKAQLGVKLVSGEAEQT